MNKTQLVDAIASEADVTKIEARKCLDAFLRLAGQALRDGEKITLSGFGTFTVLKHPGRTGRNFRTGNAIKIPPRNVVKFRPGVELSSLIS